MALASKIAHTHNNETKNKTFTEFNLYETQNTQKTT